MNREIMGKTLKYLFAIAIFVGLLLLLFRLFRPSPTVWVSTNPHIVLFEHRLLVHSPYLSPFAAHGSVGSRGYMVDDEGEVTYFFYSYWRDIGLMNFYDAYTFFDSSQPRYPIMRGYRQSRRWNRLAFNVDGELITFNRVTEYGSPLNTFLWLPGLETLHGVWETEDGRLRLDLTSVTLERTDSRQLDNLFMPSRLPRFHGVYDPNGENISILISGSGRASHEGKFSITISENGNLPGHSFWLTGGGRQMRADATLDGDTIHLDIARWRTNPFRCDWHLSFPNEFALYRVST